MSKIPTTYPAYWKARARIKEQRFDRSELEHHLAESNVNLERLEVVNAALLAACETLLSCENDDPLGGDTKHLDLAIELAQQAIAQAKTLAEPEPTHA